MAGARNMVRALRDSGLLTAPLPETERARLLTTSVMAAAFGAVAYIAAVYAIPQFPNLVRMVQKPPAETHFVKPD
jgi:hypothetical protein